MMIVASFDWLDSVELGSGPARDIGVPLLAILICWILWYTTRR
jgi:hypothetical protein